MGDAAEVADFAFKIESVNGMSTVYFFARLDVNSSRALERDLTDGRIVTPNDWVFDCRNLDLFPPAIVRAAVGLNQWLKPKKRALRLVNVNEKMNAFLKTQGVLNLLGGITLAEPAKPKKSFDVSFINPFLEATIKVFKMNAGMDISPGKMMLRGAKDPFEGDVSAVMALNTNDFSGSIVVSWQKGLLLQLLKRIHNEDHADLNQRGVDCALELMTMIFGQGKSSLNTKGYGIQPTVPMVLLGTSFASLNEGRRISVPFTCEFGHLNVEILEA